MFKNKNFFLTFSYSSSIHGYYEQQDTKARLLVLDTYINTTTNKKKLCY